MRKFLLLILIWLCGMTVMANVVVNFQVTKPTETRLLRERPSPTMPLSSLRLQSTERGMWNGI